jgi:hypothetical protein
MAMSRRFLNRLILIVLSLFTFVTNSMAELNLFFLKMEAHSF